MDICALGEKRIEMDEDKLDVDYVKVWLTTQVHQIEMREYFIIQCSKT